jgi:hypothetical protein
MDWFTVLTQSRNPDITPTYWATAEEWGSPWVLSERFDCFNHNLQEITVPDDVLGRNKQVQTCMMSCALNPSCTSFNFPRPSNWNVQVRGKKVCYLKEGYDAINNPQNGTKCVGGFFTPYWDYYSKADKEEEDHTAAIVGGTLGVASAGLLAGLLGGLLTPAPPVLAMAPPIFNTTTTTTTPVPEVDWLALLMPWVLPAAVAAGALAAALWLLLRPKEIESEEEEEVPAPKTRAVKLEPPPPEPVLNLIFEEPDGGLCVEEYPADTHFQLVDELGVQEGEAVSLMPASSVLSPRAVPMPASSVLSPRGVPLPYGHPIGMGQPLIGSPITSAQLSPLVTPRGQEQVFIYS